MPSKFYLAGPMTGKLDHNYPQFEECARVFRERLHIDILSPAEHHGEDTGQSWEYYLRADIGLLIQCDAIILMEGWQASRGATLEEYVADALNMHIFFVGPNYSLVRSRRGNQNETELIW